MANKIQLRRDTGDNWARVNPILDDGEPGLNITTNQVKYGDGANAWVDLSYASGGTGNGGGSTLVNDTRTVSLGSNGILTMPPGNETTSGWIQWSHASDDLTNVAGAGFVDYFNAYTGLGLTAPTDTNAQKGIWFGTPSDPSSPFQPETSMVFRNDTLYLPKNGYIKSHDINFVGYANLTTVGTNVTIQTNNAYDISSLAFTNTANSSILFDGFTVGPLKSNSFTIEFFFNLDDDPGAIQHCFLGSGATGGLSIYTGAGVGSPNYTTITVDCDSNSNQQFTVPSLNSAWHHLILVRRGAPDNNPGSFGAMAMWYDGIRVGSFNDTTEFNGITEHIGMWDNTGMHLVGRMAGLRITNTAEYDVNVETYPVPTNVAPLVTGTRLLMRVANDGTDPYTDSSPNHYVMTPGPDVSINSGGVNVPGTTDLVKALIDHNWNFSADGTISFPNYTFPVVDGDTNQVLSTDGFGTLSWIDSTSNYIANGTSGVTIPGLDGHISVTVAGNNIATFSNAGVDFPFGNITIAGEIHSASGIGNVAIQSNDGINSRNFVFNTDGSITLPSLYAQGNASIDSSNNQVQLNSSDTVDFSNFSGMVLVNCYNSGQVAMYLCGGTDAQAIGNSGVAGTGTMAYNSGILGYTFTATETGTHVFSSIKTRTIA